MADQTQAPPVQPGSTVQQASLKQVHISGTDLSFALGETQTYLDPDGKAQTSTIIGFGVVKQPQFIGNPPQPNPDFGFVQVQVVFEDGYRDVYLLADHLVVQNIHIHAVTVVRGPKLVVPQ